METVKVYWDKWLKAFQDGGALEKTKLLVALILAIPILVVIYPISLFFPKGGTNV